MLEYGSSLTKTWVSSQRLGNGQALRLSLLPALPVRCVTSAHLPNEQVTPSQPQCLMS